MFLLIQIIKDYINPIIFFSYRIFFLFLNYWKDINVSSNSGKYFLKTLIRSLPTCNTLFCKDSNIITVQLSIFSSKDHISKVRAKDIDVLQVETSNL